MSLSAPELHTLFYALLFVVAFLYAAVGHGGASGYLALMALFSLSPAIMKPSALVLNIFVSLIAFTQYYRTVTFDWRLFAALAGLAIPAAFLGGMISLDQDVYKKILGAFLIIPIIKFAGLFPGDATVRKDFSLPQALLIGAAIGLLSGLIGIGGGIILSPILLFLAWADMKETAAISALFITVNSVAGLMGNATTGLEVSADLVYLVLIAVAGGAIGAFCGANYFANVALKRLLALVLVIASVKLLLT